MKILNLYCGIGGNRKLWGDEHEITAVENVPEIAKIYQDFFPNDKVIIADAHQYILDHFKEFDFIWSSPPCPTHSICNHFLQAQGNIRYPDMSLWQEIVFLQKWFKGKWVVENVKSYYPPLWKPKLLDRHYFWSNFDIPNFKVERNFNICKARASIRKNQEEDIRELENYHKIKLPENSKDQRLLLRNCVYPELGLHILKSIYEQEAKEEQKVKKEMGSD
jgi:DNA (cytosine-5)-methyltransferase 1